jgi:hypothetical protein
LTLVLVTVWYVFLTQLKIRWAVWLPFYSILYPSYWVLKTGLSLFGKAIALITSGFWSLFKRLDPGRRLGDAPTKARRRIPTKRIWLSLFFLWFVAFRTLDIWWAAWIAPFLAVPIWLFFVRAAYRLAIAPKTFATLFLTACGSMLDNQIRTFTDAKGREGKVASASAVYSVVDWVLRRYPDAEIHTVVQRESMLMFSAALAFALIVSAWFWGLIGVALLRTDPHILDSYAFFNGTSLTESFLWAWGCMTTAVSFPARAAPTWLKAVHGGMLATGVFQLTFLLACFSIMVNAETARAVSQATALLKDAREKLERTKRLELTVMGTHTALEQPKPADEVGQQSSDRLNADDRAEASSPPEEAVVRPSTPSRQPTSGSRVDVE